MEGASSNDKAHLLVGNFALNLRQLPLMFGKVCERHFPCDHSTTLPLFGDHQYHIAALGS